MQKLEAVITNIAYIAAGIFRLAVNPAVGVSSILLGIGSGIHHAFLTRFTRRLDYFGMYAVCLSVIGVHFVGQVSIYFAIGAAILLVSALDPSRVLLGGLIGLAVITVGLRDVGLAFEASAILSIAFGFNFMADRIFAQKYHSVIHGISWHIPTAYVIYLIA